ncbi:MAG: hypothetical protein OSB43_16330 [Nocardioides sp.]|uniref:hypothetical protein n=1 Tax=Nocardioides sp. TaxID=35761 RepID=UPI0023A68C9A|nr:hypothetical protein [Nocardioides sp.]MDE0777844.1 hypothetical protein [Nocardioides sp.]
MPLVEVTVDPAGCLDVRLEREPYAADGALERGDLQRLVGGIADDLGTPVRVEVHEADGTGFTDIVTPSESAELAAGASEEVPVPQLGAPLVTGVVAGVGFTPDESVAVAVVVAHQVASSDGSARLRLPPALLTAHPGLVVLIGETSGTIIVSGAPA